MADPDIIGRHWRDQVKLLETQYDNLTFDRNDIAKKYVALERDHAAITAALEAEVAALRRQLEGCRVQLQAAKANEDALASEMQNVESLRVSELANLEAQHRARIGLLETDIRERDEQIGDLKIKNRQLMEEQSRLLKSIGVLNEKQQSNEKAEAETARESAESGGAGPVDLGNQKVYKALRDSLEASHRESQGLQMLLLDADHHLEDKNRKLELARLGQDAAIKRAVAQTSELAKACEEIVALRTDMLNLEVTLHAQHQATVTQLTTGLSDSRQELARFQRLLLLRTREVIVLREKVQHLTRPCQPLNERHNQNYK